MKKRPAGTVWKTFTKRYRPSTFTVIPRAPQPEWKFIDQRITSSTIPGSAVVNLMNGCGQGAASNARIGNKINIMSYEIRAEFRSSGTASNALRFIVLVDTQPNGAAPVLGSMFANSTYYTSMRNLYYRKRFKFLLDTPFTISPGGQQGDNKYIHHYYKFPRGLICEYNSGNTGTITDISTNALYFVIPGYTACNMDLQFRVRLYRDWETDRKSVV